MRGQVFLLAGRPAAHPPPSLFPPASRAWGGERGGRSTPSNPHQPDRQVSTSSGRERAGARGAGSARARSRPPARRLSMRPRGRPPFPLALLHLCSRTSVRSWTPTSTAGSLAAVSEDSARGERAAIRACVCGCVRVCARVRGAGARTRDGERGASCVRVRSAHARGVRGCGVYSSVCATARGRSKQARRRPHAPRDREREPGKKRVVLGGGPSARSPLALGLPLTPPSCARGAHPPHKACPDTTTLPC